MVSAQKVCVKIKTLRAVFIAVSEEDLGYIRFWQYRGLGTH